MSDPDPDPQSRSSPVPECWYDLAQSINRSFYLRIKDLLEKDQNEQISCHYTSQDTLIQAICRCIIRSLDHSMNKTVYVITELPSINILHYLQKIIKMPSGTEFYTYPRAMMTVSKIKWNDPDPNKFENCTTIEFIQSMNDRIMERYRKNTFRGISGPLYFVIDTTTVKEEFFNSTLVPLMMTSENTFQYLLVD